MRSLPAVRLLVRDCTNRLACGALVLVLDVGSERKLPGWQEPATSRSSLSARENLRLRREQSYFTCSIAGLQEEFSEFGVFFRRTWSMEPPYFGNRRELECFCFRFAEILRFSLDLALS